MPRGLEALTIVIDHREPSITSRETRVVSGKVTSSKDSTTTIDDMEHVWHPEPGSTVKQRQTWSGTTLLKHWEKTVKGTKYISDIKQTLSDGGKVVIMSEYYREPGMERIRDWLQGCLLSGNHRQAVSLCAPRFDSAACKTDGIALAARNPSGDVSSRRC